MGLGAFGLPCWHGRGIEAITCVELLDKWHAFDAEVKILTKARDEATSNELSEAERGALDNLADYPDTGAQEDGLAPT